MAVRSAIARWEGDLRGGGGTMALGSGAFEGQYSYRSRFEEGAGTNPEELIGAAHAGCFTMALANMLAEAGHTANQVETTARVHFEPVDSVPTITWIELSTEGDVPEVDEAEFERHADAAKQGCAVSRALGGVDISLEAKLVAGSARAA